MGLLDRGVGELAELIRRREVSPVDVVREAIECAERDRHLNAYAWLVPEQVLAAARTAERELRRGRDRGPLHGLPVAVKDNIDTAGVPTTGGSRVLRDRVPARDAVAWRRLRRAGAVLLGKTNLHEFAYGAPHPDFGAVHNPHRQGFSPGGSSSGSAAAVAAGHVVAALGTDTGGSVRQPAAFCGIVGLKPGPGRIPTKGVLPLSTTLDAVGVLCRDLADTRILFGVLAGRPGTARTGSPPLRIGVVRAQEAAISSDVQRAVSHAAKRFESAGCRVEDVDLPPLDVLHGAHRVILAAEAFAIHRATFERALDDYGPEFRAAVLPGALISAADYLVAQQERTLRSREIVALMTRHDILLLPTTPGTAPPLDPRTGRAGTSGGELTRWTFLANFVKLPAISVPAGSSDGLPIGVQLMCGRGAETLLLDAAEIIFQAPGGAPRSSPRSSGSSANRWA